MGITLIVIPPDDELSEEEIKELEAYRNEQLRGAKWALDAYASRPAELQQMSEENYCKSIFLSAAFLAVGNNWTLQQYMFYCHNCYQMVKEDAELSETAKKFKPERDLSEMEVKGHG